MRLPESRIAAAAAALLFAGFVQAGGEGRMPSATGTLTRFTIPERNREGKLIWQMTGEKAQIRPDNQMEIEHLAVNTFKEAKVDWTLETPACIMNRETREAVSEADVKITNQQIIITGVGFHWIANESRFVVRSRVEVLIPGSLVKEQIP
ncbi:MAG: LPS export ABC transporter periplasmic protein LptC [Verrucomicrobiae bacterium]|nr:LPS export ABC transporter periplasmic protein LptC [Verrucomicrobiae bacterium]